jgi:SAM-dependent methyltransferase
MTTTTVISFEEIKRRQHQIWSSGNYGKIAWLTVPLGDALCEAVDLRAGSTALDVATGTGHVALAAARRFGDVTGIDYVPELLEIARRRAAAEGLEVDFRDADAENLPFPEDSFDYVLSAIGVMFTADHERAASELVRVCRPDGRIGLASWTPTGFVGQMLKVVSEHVPPPPGAKSPTRWGTEDAISELLGAGVDELTCTRAAVTQRLPSAEFFADFFLQYYGPTLKAFERLSVDGQRALRDDLITLAVESNRASDASLVCDWEYLVAVARKV